MLIREEPYAAELVNEPLTLPSFPLPARWPRWLRAVVGSLAFLFGVLGFLTAYAALTLPDVNTLGAATGAIRVLDRNGQLIAEVGQHGGNRRTVSLKEIAPVMRDATLAAEDRNFYKEGAFDAPRILKAMLVDTLSGHPEEGASTITQQLARNALLSPHKSILRKLREALLAQQIDARYGKDAVFEMYLNEIYYGEGAYGVEAAAQTYFGKQAAQLNLAQASLMAGLPAAPSFDDPLINPRAALARQQYVLDGMVAMGTISSRQADALERPASRQALLAALRRGQPRATDLAPDFVRFVQNELHREFGENSPLFNGLLTVTTSLDLGLQQQAQRAVSQGIAQLGRGANNGALLMLDPRNGAIEAMVGSADYSNADIGGQFNLVTAERRPGSTFKPYVYAAGFAEGRLTPSTVLDDTAQESRQLGGVQDFDHRYLGRISASEALLYSRNIATEQAMQRAGIDNVIAFAHRLGISSALAPNPSTAIGSSAVTMLDQAAAYAAFANGGMSVAPHAILRVNDQRGTLVRDNSERGPVARVMTPQVACAINSILRRYPPVWNLPFNRPTAGKSGTTDGFVDAWYIAYTPQWVVATWAGHTSASGGEVGMQGVYGTTMARYLAVPFVNGLPEWGGSFACGESEGSGNGQGDGGGGGGDEGGGD